MSGRVSPPCVPRSRPRLSVRLACARSFSNKVSLSPVQRFVSDPRVIAAVDSWAELSSMAVRVELEGEWAELCSTCPLEL